MLRNDVIGTTLGELTLLLVFTVLIIFYLANGNVDYDEIKIKNKIEELESSLKKEQLSKKEFEIENIRLQKSINDANKKTSEILSEFDVIKRRLDLEKKNRKTDDLKSKQLPSCIEAQVADAFIGSVTILGSDSYEINSTKYDFKGLISFFSEDLTKAQNKGCVQSLNVFTPSTVSLIDYHEGLQKLERHFYIRRAGIR
jgi:hypothetical protein